ncbi:MAG TPA: hypothetical protein VKU94_01945, partial [Geobacterales bacterium]|nr:hypothetical protein [Geobacterales bacterium]
MYLISSISGYYILDEEFRVIDGFQFSKNPSEVANELFSIEKGRETSNLGSILSRIKNQEVKVINKYLFEILRNKRIKATLIEEPRTIIKKLRSVEENLAKKEFDDILAYRSFLKEVLSELTRLKIREEHQNRDKLIIQAIEAIDELDKSINLLVSRLNEWYGLYFPELYKIINDNELFSKIISKIIAKQEMNEEVLKSFNLTDEKIKRIIEASRKSIGTDLPTEDLDKIKEMAILVRNLYERRKDMENY